MELSEDNNNYDSDNVDSIFNWRSSAIAISNYKNKLFIHTNIAELKNSEIKEHKFQRNLIESNELKSNIIDVNKLTKSISIDSIKLLILNELSSKTEEIQLYSDVFNKRE